MTPNNSFQPTSQSSPRSLCAAAELHRQAADRGQAHVSGGVACGDRIESTDVADATFTIPLRGRKGHYSQPAHVFRNPDDAPTPWSADISCKHNAKELIRFTFTALYEA